MGRMLLGISLLLNIALLGGGAYMFMKGSVAPSEDGRTAIVLDKGEKAFVLTEMRALLETVHAVLLAVEDGDMKEAGIAARKFGMADMQAAPKSLMLKMPMGFKSLGHAMHTGWDTIANEAESMGDKKKVTVLLTEQLGRCTACHSAFKLK